MINCPRSPRISNGVLLVTEQNADVAAVESQIAHEKTRSTSRIAADHLDADVLAVSGHREVDIDQVRRLRDGPVQAVDFLIRAYGSGVDVDVPDADVEVVCARLPIVVRVDDGRAVRERARCLERGHVDGIADDLRVDEELHGLGERVCSRWDVDQGRLACGTTAVAAFASASVCEIRR